MSKNGSFFGPVQFQKPSLKHNFLRTSKNQHLRKTKFLQIAKGQQRVRPGFWVLLHMRESPKITKNPHLRKTHKKSAQHDFFEASPKSFSTTSGIKIYLEMLRRPAKLRTGIAAVQMLLLPAAQSWAHKVPHIQTIWNNASPNARYLP